MAEGQFGRFQIRGELGLGGMARVYQAYDPRRRGGVAIKVLPPEYLNDLGFRARLEQEAQLVIALKHKAIVPVYEYGEHEGQPYIVMKYMPKGSLAGRLLYGPLALEQVAGILGRISSALDYAHQQGVVHRDLKPSNILFDQSDKAYLADFGIAMQAGQAGQANQAGQGGFAWEPTRTISGTPAYMSPEQVLREQIDFRSDIYSLGVIVFEMLCGRLPFQGDSPIVVALKQVYDPPPRLATIRAGLPSALEHVVLCALSKDVQERYQTATAFAEAFRQALQTDPATPEAVEASTDEGSAETGSLHLASKQPEGQPPKAGLQMRVSTALPALPEIQALQARRNWRTQHVVKFRMLERLIVALVLATGLGVLLAVSIAAFAWGGATAADAKIQMVYDNAGMAVINLSGRPLDIASLSFQRVAESGEVTASFAATQWEQSGLGPAGALPDKACYQLMNLSQVPQPISPGEAPDKPAACQVSQGWLFAVNNNWQFWTAESGGNSFKVLYAGRTIHTCRIAEGSCQFTLPEP